jgi:hypothetical protein
MVPPLKIELGRTPHATLFYTPPMALATFGKLARPP